MINRIETTAAQHLCPNLGSVDGVFRVPAQPPDLPTAPGENLESFRPAPGFLRYLKFQFWIGLAIIDLLIFFGWVAITVAAPIAGVILAVPALVLAILPDIAAYVAIHLRYDTTWYVMSHRSLRLRRGIWVIHETTLTFENIQNVSVRQGPLQRWFGIADLLVETAGGGGDANSAGHSGLSHRGLIEGVANAEQIRDQILHAVRPRCRMPVSAMKPWLPRAESFPFGRPSIFTRYAGFGCPAAVRCRTRCQWSWLVERA